LAAIEVAGRQETIRFGQRLLQALAFLPEVSRQPLISVVAWACPAAYITEITATATSAAATTDAVASTARFRRANLRNRYYADGGHACTGSSSR
jgi:hypothetical protein